MKRTPTHDSGGFSLIEVTIALAIASVAIVSLVAMIPQGLEAMREAGDKAIMGRIHQSILSEVQMTPFRSSVGAASPLDALHGELRYFDNQGEEISPSRRGSLEHVYSARIHIPQPGDGLPPTVGTGGFDGVTFGDEDQSENLRLVIVEVAATGGREGPSQSFDWENEDNLDMIATYQTIIARTGQDYSGN